MSRIKYGILFFLFLLPIFVDSQTKKNTVSINEDTVTLFDISRNRPIPLTIYSPKKLTKKTPIVIMNHGYGRNNPGSYQTYSSITRKLASEGYYVISIQHELPTDSLLAMNGNFLETRMPNWQKGVDNILFTIKQYKVLYPDLNWSDVSLIGHSNGGDMVMLFAAQYFPYIKRSISLDNRRMPIPLSSTPRIFSLRGCDYEADEGVIPSEENQRKYLITIIYLKDIKHGDMDDKGSPAQIETINSYLLYFLKQ